MKGTIAQFLALCLLTGVGGLASAEEIVNNGSFEIEEDTVGLFLPPGNTPIDYDDWWQADFSEIVGAQDGITPADGDKMLHLQGTVWGPGQSLEENTACDAWQLIDITPYASAISAGVAEVSASALFNRVAGDEETDNEFQLSIWAFEGDPATVPTTMISQANRGTQLAYNEAMFRSDANVDTWEQATAHLVLPTGTTFVGVKLRAIENVVNDTEAPELDGHYVDAVSVNIVPEPGSLALALGAGLVGLLYLVKRRRVRD